MSFGKITLSGSQLCLMFAVKETHTGFPCGSPKIVNKIRFTHVKHQKGGVPQSVVERPESCQLQALFRRQTRVNLFTQIFRQQFCGSNQWCSIASGLLAMGNICHYLEAISYFKCRFFSSSFLLQDFTKCLFLLCANKAVLDWC